MSFLAMPAVAGRYANAIAGAGGLQGRVLWCDGEANVFALDSREKVADLVNRCKQANINTVVVDVKPLSGVVMYDSKISPKLRQWQGKPYPEDYDLLQTMVSEGHAVGLEVHAAVNVFSEGAANRDDAGPAFTHPQWQCTKYEVERWARGSGADAYPIDGVNKPVPPKGRLALITEDKFLPKLAAPDMVRVAVDVNDKIVSVATAETPEVECKAPSGGFVLVGTGPAAGWLTVNAAVGGNMTIEGKARFVPVAKSADEHLAVFVNPANPEVRKFELSIISEIIKNYDVDGMVFDRMRYPGMYADFSEESRTAFEAWLGQKVEIWPDQIMTIDPIPGRPIVRGRYFGKWMEWRAKQIHDFVAEARETVKSIRPKALVGAYVGSWYSEYYDVGANWASPNHEPPYDFAGPTYRDTGYADLVDWMCTGCYYPYASREEARAAGANEAGSVEAACQESSDVVEDDTFVYGSLYVLQYAKDPAALERAIAMCTTQTQGVMLFDLVYLRDYNWWDVLKRVFAAPAKPPHSIPGLIEKVKETRRLVEEFAKTSGR